MNDGITFTWFSASKDTSMDWYTNFSVYLRLKLYSEESGWKSLGKRKIWEWVESMEYLHNLLLLLHYYNTLYDK